MKKLIFVLMILAKVAYAIDIPQQIPLGASDFTHRSLGDSCYTMDAVVDGLPCNPAFTAKERRTRFQTHLFFGNNISYVHDVTDVMNNSADQQTIQRLFTQKRSSEMEANIEAGFLTEKYGISFSPYRLSYYSLVRNSSLPVITVYAGQEQTLTGQIASYTDHDLFFGLQLRAVDRKFVLSEFTLPDVLAEDGRDDVFRIKEQRAIYVEPGMVWSPEDRYWNPQVSFAITQLGAVDKKYDELPASPQGHLGGSVKPPVHLGELEFGANFTAQSEYAKWTDLFRLAASYKLGATQYVASFNEDEYDLAFLLHYKTVRGGLTYDYKRFTNLLGDRDEVRTVYVQIGVEI